MKHSLDWWLAMIFSMIALGGPLLAVMVTALSSEIAILWVLASICGLAYVCSYRVTEGKWWWQ